MPKKAKSAKKLGKIVVQSDTDDDDFKKPRKKKGRKIAISDSSDDEVDEVTFSALPKSKGKIHLICCLDNCSRYSQLSIYVELSVSRICFGL